MVGELFRDAEEVVGDDAGLRLEGGPGIVRVVIVGRGSVFTMVGGDRLN